MRSWLTSYHDNLVNDRQKYGSMGPLKPFLCHFISNLTKVLILNYT